MPRGTDRLGYIQALPRTALGTTGPFIFYERGWLVRFGGGGEAPRKKIGLKGGGGSRKNEGKGGGSDEKIRLKIG